MSCHRYNKRNGVDGPPLQINGCSANASNASNASDIEIELYERDGAAFFYDPKQFRKEKTNYEGGICIESAFSILDSGQYIRVTEMGWKYLHYDVCNKISDFLYKLLKNTDKNVENVILLGSFTQSKILKHWLKRDFPKINFYPPHPKRGHVAHVEGALYWICQKSDEKEEKKMANEEAIPHRKKQVLDALNKNKYQTIKNPFVIIVGVADYDQAPDNWKSLDGVKQDVLRMVHVWKDIYGYNDISIVFKPNNDNNSNNNNKNNNILQKLDKYKQHFNYPYKKKDSNTILSDKQSFQDYLVRIRGKIEDSESNDGLIFYYSGHGIKDKIILSNGKSFSIRQIIDIFDGKQCVQLRNTPKVMIYDCCRGNGVAQSYKDEINANKVEQKTRGNGASWYDDMNHVNSGLATIFSNFSGYSVNDSSLGGHLTRAIEDIFQDPKLIEKESLRDLVLGIRKLTKISAGRGDESLNWSAQLVDFHETLECKVYFERNNE